MSDVEIVSNLKAALKTNDDEEYRTEITTRLKAKCKKDLIGSTPNTKEKAKKCFKTYFDMGEIKIHLRRRWN